ncbi:similar to hypothetical protein MGC38960 (predicted), isoform CRA_c [Rattus norvegicus]|uniref:Uncharacterized protein n=1 Tax=Rattus norvegicus TaxID=10116 RepID=A6I1A6_RAT|nr:similar to hypothetical protein MGC38960 (predicted), isoform CRA_c [Rattus norvegicus]
MKPDRGSTIPVSDVTNRLWEDTRL